jgi:GntR family transcriptional regulator
MSIDKDDGAAGGGTGAPLAGGVDSGQHLRVSDAERETAAGALAGYFAAGRLDQAEFDDRVGRAMSARTRADLSGLFADLPETGAAAVPGLPRGGGPPGGGPREAGSPIEFRLDAGSGVPTYLQLVHQVEHALRLGYLKPGDQLPKVRDVVAVLAINPNTVLKAYKELEVKGLTAGRPGQGTFIQATLSQVALPELTALRRSLAGWLATADGAGLDQDGIVALFTSALRDFHERRGGAGDRRGGTGGETEGVA